MDLDHLFTLALFAFWVLGLASRIRRETKRPGSGEVTASPQGTQESSASPRTSRVAECFERQRVLADSGEELEERLENVRRRVRALAGPVEILVELLDGRVGPDLAGLTQEIARLGSRLEAQVASGGPGNLPDERVFAKLERGLEQVARQLHVLAVMAGWRSDRELGHLLADADALACALLTPMTHLARSEEVPFPEQRVVCAPADPEQESVWFGLLPKGHPVIFVPDDFEEDLYRWASLPHEIGHVLWRRLPGFQNEVRARLGLHGHAMLMSPNDNYTLDLEVPFRAWIEEISSDAIACLMLGPAALRGFVHSFANSEEPEEVVWAPPGAAGRYGDHPPAHLRVLLSAALLTHIGFDAEAGALVSEWNALHETPTHVLLPTRDGRVARMPVEPLLEQGRAYLEHWYQGGYRSLGGREIQAVHGLEMSPGLWAQVRRARQRLVEGRPVTGDPRIVLAAGIEARAAKPAQANRIARALMAAIRGLGSHDASPKRAPVPEARAGGGLSASELRAALIFRELMARPRPGVLPVARAGSSAGPSSERI